MTVDADTLDRLRTVVAPVGDLVGATHLTGGMFATTYRVTLVDGPPVVVKTAPTATERLLTYEHDLLRTEALVYRLAEAHPDLLMPRVLHTDLTRTTLPSDVLVVSHLDGVPLLEVGYPPGDPRAARAEHDLGALMARLHRITGERFGYPNAATGLVGATWPEAFGRMVGALLADADAWGTPVPAARVRAALHTHHDALAQVRVPALVHTDLWPGNLFVAPETGELVGVIDTERALWGDPLFELAGADQMGRGPVPVGLIAGYESAGGRLDLDSADGRARLLLYRMAMSLVLVVEIAPRGYVGDWLAGHRGTAEANLAAMLEALGV